MSRKRKRKSNQRDLVGVETNIISKLILRMHQRPSLKIHRRDLKLPWKALMRIKMSQRRKELGYRPRLRNSLRRHNRRENL